MEDIRENLIREKSFDIWGEILYNVPFLHFGGLGVALLVVLLLGMYVGIFNPFDCVCGGYLAWVSGWSLSNQGIDDPMSGM